MKFTTNLVVLVGLWLIITEARADAWIVGAPVVLAAAVAATYCSSASRWRWNLVGFLQFVPLFVRDSFLGGLDVAWRACHPGLPIDPALIEYQPRFPKGAARVFFVNTVNLLPGTLIAGDSDKGLLVHVIDRGQPIHQELTKLEQAVARLFGLRLDSTVEQGE